LASGDTEDTAFLVTNGVIPLFADYIGHQSLEVSVQAIWGISNIAGENSQYRDLVLGLHSYDKVITRYYNSDGNISNPALTISHGRTLSFFFLNITRGKPVIQYSKVSGIIFYLRKLLERFFVDNEVKMDVLWSFAYVTETEEGMEEFATLTDFLPMMSGLLALGVDPITSPTLRILGNLSSSNDEHTQLLIDYNLLPIILNLTDHKKKAIRKEALFLLSNVAAGTLDQVQELLKYEDLFLLLKKILSGDEMSVCKEALWIVGNITVKPEFLTTVISKGLVLDFVKAIINYEEMANEKRLRAFFLETLSPVIDYFCLGASELDVSQYLEEIAQYLSFIGVVINHCTDKEIPPWKKNEEKLKAFLENAGLVGSSGVPQLNQDLDNLNLNDQNNGDPNAGLGSSGEQPTQNVP